MSNRSDYYVVVAQREEPEDRVDRRQALIEAAWTVVDTLPLSKVFAGATSAAVARQAGVTTGSFFHHFASSAEFADAMVRSVAVPPPDQDPSSDEFIDALDHMEMTDAIRSASHHVWDLFTGDEHFAAANRHVLLLKVFQHTSLSGTDDAAGTVGDLLRQVQRAGERSGVAMSEEVLRRSRRTPVEPFTVERLVVALTALFDGLAQRHALDPDTVDDDLFADVVGVLVATLTQPVGSRRHVEDVTALDGLALSPQARVGAMRRDATRRRIVERAAGLFADGWDDVTASDVADRAGVSTQTVLNAFGSVRSVAAATFGRHVLAVVVPGDEVPRTGVLRSVLVQLAAAASADAGAARALLDERLDDRHRRPLERPGVDEFVPLADLVEPLVAAVLDGRADERPSADELTGAVVDLVLRQGVALAGDPGAAADLALRLLVVVPPAGSSSDSSRRTTRR